MCSVALKLRILYNSDVFIFIANEGLLFWKAINDSFFPLSRTSARTKSVHVKTCFDSSQMQRTAVKHVSTFSWDIAADRGETI